MIETEPGCLLLERERELAAVQRLLADAIGGRGGTLVVDGQAGVGKTRLLRAAAESARAAGFTVLWGRGSELERAFGFGLVRQLLARVVAGAPELLSGGAEGARPALVEDSPAGAGDQGSEFGILRGLEWLVGDLAARGPVAVVADDLHWADAASLRFLVLLAERVEDLRLVLVVAMRPREPGADQVLLDALVAASASMVVRPSPLSPGATARVVRARLGSAAADEFVSACHRASGGNPFLLGELVGEMAADGVAGSPSDAQRVLGFGTERVGRAVRRRLRALGPEATPLARAVAVLGPGTGVRDAALLGGLEQGPAADAAGELMGVDVFAVGDALDFVHPLVAAAVYDSIAVRERAALHTAAAEMLAEAGADAERVGAHLLRLAPAGDQARVEGLRAAARRAAARGAPDAAARYLARALEEPPAAGQQGPVLHELGLAEATDRRRESFEEHLRAALASTRDASTRAAIALDLGRALAASGEFGASVAVLDAALGELDDLDAPLGVCLEAELLTMSFNDFGSAPLAAPRWKRRFAQLEAGVALDPQTLACLVLGRVASYPPAGRALELADRVMATTRLDELNSVVAGCLGNALIFAGRPARAARFYDETIAAATRRGSRLASAWQLVMRADPALRLGQVRRAEADARTGLELFGTGSGAAAYAWGLAHLLGALVARGALEEAEDLVNQELVDEHAPPSFPLALFLSARTRLRLAQGRPAPALEDARAAGALVLRSIFNPGCSGWRGDAALALAGLERRDEARAVAEDELGWARRFDVPDAIGAALRTLGVVLLGRERLEALRESVAVLERAEGRLGYARSLLELGAALRHAGERGQSRDVLRAALDLTARAGASGLADRAHAELVAAGARPRRERRLLSGRESLTASEDRVAVLAAEG